jgi:hypothetical protein
MVAQMTLAEVEAQIEELEAEITKENVALACGKTPTTEAAARLTSLSDALTLLQMHRETLLAGKH